jgi:hypothetical protein
VKESDLKYSESIQKSFGRQCEIKICKDIKIGGIRGFSALQGLVADSTLDAKLEDQKEWAAENFGAQLI